MNDDFMVRMIERENGAPENIGALQIEMWMGTRQSARKSKKAGYPVFEEVPWIRISVPGEMNKSVPERPATETDKQRFPRAYAALMAAEKTSVPVDGMPLEHWPRMTRSMVLTLRAQNIHTVEALAAVDDNNIGKVGPEGRRLRSEAQAHLLVAKDSAAAQRIQAESDVKDATMAEMQRQIKELAARLEAKDEMVEPRRGPGRPRKEEAAA